MRLTITWQYVIAFIALNMVMGELHEQVHIVTGYFICGCYGPRDISSWSTCENCAAPAWALLATATGPLFSYLMMWWGACWFLGSSNRSRQGFGFALLFANLPFARIFTAFMGGGDEKLVIQQLMGDQTSLLVTRAMASLFVTLICLPPIIMVARKLTQRRRLLIVAGLLILPLVWGIIYQRMFINGLLEKGIGDEVVILGTPNLILLHFVGMFILFFIFRKSLLLSFVTQKK